MFVVIEVYFGEEILKAKKQRQLIIKLRAIFHLMRQKAILIYSKEI